MCEDCENGDADALTSVQKRKLINAYWRRAVGRSVGAFVAQRADPPGTNHKGMRGLETKD
jgi:hypothetical protein